MIYLSVRVPRVFRWVREQWLRFLREVEEVEKLNARASKRKKSRADWDADWARRRACVLYRAIEL